MLASWNAKTLCHVHIEVTCSLKARQLQPSWGGCRGLYVVDTRYLGGVWTNAFAVYPANGFDFDQL